MAEQAAPIIRFDGVSKHFDAFQVLKNISFEVAKGERIVICGPSGSGKSTLIRCINGLEEYGSGLIEVGGVALKPGTAGARKVRATVGMVFQQFNLFPHLTVIENLMLGPMRARGMSREQAREIATRFLARVHIPEQSDKYPRQLSGGQQQRVAIARSLCMEPSIMLFDEPTSALDPELEQEVVRVIKALAEEGRTMLLVTHDMRLAADVSDHVVFLHQGRIEEEGPPDSLFGAPKTNRLRGFLNATQPA